MGKIAESTTAVRKYMGRRCDYMLEKWDEGRTHIAPRFGDLSIALNPGAVMISNAAAETLAESANVLLPEQRQAVIIDYHIDRFLILYYQNGYFLYQGYVI